MSSIIEVEGSKYSVFFLFLEMWASFPVELYIHLIFVNKTPSWPFLRQQGLDLTTFDIIIITIFCPCIHTIQLALSLVSGVGLDRSGPVISVIWVKWLAWPETKIIFVSEHDYNMYRRLVSSREFPVQDATEWMINRDYWISRNCFNR